VSAVKATLHVWIHASGFRMLGAGCMARGLDPGLRVSGSWLGFRVEVWVEGSWLGFKV